MTRTEYHPDGFVAQELKVWGWSRLNDSWCFAESLVMIKLIEEFGKEKAETLLKDRTLRIVPTFVRVPEG